VRFQHVTPDWTGWQQPEDDAAEAPPEPSGRLRSFVRGAVDGTRGRSRRADGDRH
jgi:hypothetical protein